MFKKIIIPIVFIAIIAVMIIRNYTIEQSFTKSHQVDFKEVQYYAELARDVYLPHEELKAKYPSAKFETIGLPVTNGKAVVAWREGKIYVIFRGTSNLQEAVTDLKYKKEYDENLNLWIHRGFLKETNEAEEKICCHFTKEDPVIVIGHSLGGAVATIFSLKLINKGYNIEKIRTFGQPQFTTKVAIGKYTKIDYIRFCNNEDIVPKLPPLTVISKENGRYRHFGDAVILVPEGNGYVYLEENDASNILINSVYGEVGEIRHGIKDHFMKNYVATIKKKKDVATEITYNDFKATYLND